VPPACPDRSIPWTSRIGGFTALRARLRAVSSSRMQEDAVGGDYRTGVVGTWRIGRRQVLLRVGPGVQPLQSVKLYV
jgi:hypothetical protein